MKYNAIALASLILLGFLQSPQAHAQNPDVYFYPAKTWVVGLSDLTASTPNVRTCAIRNEFNNGFVIQFDSSKNGLQSMHINFRQNIFKPEDQYNVAFDFADSYAKSASGVALSESILSVDLSPLKGAYAALKGASFMDVNVEGNPFRFYLIGLAENVPNYENCMVPGSISAAAMAPPPQAPLASPAPSAPPVQVAEAATPPVASSPLPAPVASQAKMAKPEPTTKRYSSSEPIVTRKVIQGGTHDFTGPKSKPVVLKEDPNPTLQKKLRAAEAALAKMKESHLDLKAENKILNNEVAQARKEAEQERISISTDNWDLERATMRYNEAERQLRLMGQKVKRERAQCDLEKKELEAMLFDPRVTEGQQLAKLADLEGQLADAQDDLDQQRIRYEERIRNLERALQTQ